MKKTLLVDFDGVIHSYTSGWQGADVIPDPPVEGAIRFLRDAVYTFDVQIYSARSAQLGGVKAMREWFADWELKTLELDEKMILEGSLGFPTEKPAAFLTIDDRCVQFNGVFPSIRELVEFKPWYER